MMDDRRVVHFLHIGKAAGTEIARIADQVSRSSTDFRIVCHGHNTRLGHLPSDEDYFFSIRSPDSRFRSSFYSRKRKGLPRYYSDWTRHEAIAFQDFEHANDLAESLFSDGAAGHKAFAAMRSISHCSMNQVDWIDQNGHFLDVRPPLSIIRQECFDEDLRRFLLVIGVASSVDLAADATTSHRNDYSGVPPLSDKALANLAEWYRQDYEMYRRCEQWIISRTDFSRKSV